MTVIGVHIGIVVHLALLLAGLSGAQAPQHIIASADRPVSVIRGLVVDVNDAVIAEVKVQLLDHPEVLRGPKSISLAERTKKQQKLAEAETDGYGTFRISGIPPGNYELRFRKAGFKLSSLIIQLVSPTAKNAQDSLKIKLEVGTIIDTIQVSPPVPPKKSQPSR